MTWILNSNMSMLAASFDSVLEDSYYVQVHNY